MIINFVAQFLVDSILLSLGGKDNMDSKVFK